MSASDPTTGIQPPSAAFSIEHRLLNSSPATLDRKASNADTVKNRHMPATTAHPNAAQKQMMAAN
jgi:hypothetical protein